MHHVVVELYRIEMVKDEVINMNANANAFLALELESSETR